VILASLKFAEHTPPVVKAEERAVKAATPADGSAGPGGPAANPKTIMVDLEKNGG